MADKRRDEPQHRFCSQENGNLQEKRSRFPGTRPSVATRSRLERHTRVQLDDAPRQGNAQERSIGVGRRGHGRGDSAEVTSCNTVVRQVEIGVIEQVEEISSDCELQVLRDIEVLRYVQVRVEETRPTQAVTRVVAEIILRATGQEISNGGTGRSRAGAAQR